MESAESKYTVRFDVFPTKLFTPSDLACPCCGLIVFNNDALACLEAFMTRLEGRARLVVGSVCADFHAANRRCPFGVHLDGKGFCIYLEGEAYAPVTSIALDCGFKFVHAFTPHHVYHLGV